MPLTNDAVNQKAINMSTSQISHGILPFAQTGNEGDQAEVVVGYSPSIIRLHIFAVLANDVFPVEAEVVWRSSCCNVLLVRNYDTTTDEVTPEFVENNLITLKERGFILNLADDYFFGVSGAAEASPGCTYECIGSEPLSWDDLNDADKDNNGLVGDNFGEQFPVEEEDEYEYEYGL